MRERIYRFLNLKDLQIRSHAALNSWNSMNPTWRCLLLSNCHQPYNNLIWPLTTSKHSICILVVNSNPCQCYISKCNNSISLNKCQWCFQCMEPTTCHVINNHLLTTHLWLTWLLWWVPNSCRTILNSVYLTKQVFNLSRVFIRQSLLIWTKLVVGLIRMCTGKNYRNVNEQICESCFYTY